MEKAAADGEQSGTGNRKRKRRAIVLPLDVSAAKVKATALTENGSETKADSRSTIHQFGVWKTRHWAKSELICPIRLDVDLDGVRFQDTFLVNA